MKEIRTEGITKEDKNGFKYNKEIRLTTREQIEKTIIEGIAYIQRKYNGKCTIGDLIKERKQRIDKLELTYLLPEPIISGKIRGRISEKRIELLEDILHMCDYANGKDFNFMTDFSQEYPEFLEKEVDLGKFLNQDFYKGFGAFLYSGSAINEKISVEDYLNDEKLALDKIKENKEKRKGGR